MDVDSEDEAPQQLPPTNTASPASNSSRSSSDNDDDSDDETGQRTAAGAQQGEVEGRNPSQTRSSTAPTSSSPYLSAVEQRRALFRSAATPKSPPKGYAIDSIFTISHSTHVNALAAPPCLSHLYTGGADGYIRRYALHATLNGTGVDNPAFNNYSMKIGGHTPSPTFDGRQPVLVGYWENEEPGDWMGDLLGGGQGATMNGEAQSKVKWGAKTSPVSTQSSVYSIAVQSEEMWGLSGTSRGTINLFTIRHDEGQIRHVFRSSDSPALSGHHSKSPVSVLTLASKETCFLSGGWDSRIIQWDLNTGAATRDYSAHTSQISSIYFRPTSSPSSSRDAKTNGASPAVSDTSSSGGVAASLGKPVASAVDALAKDTTMDDGGSEADADGEEVDDEAMLPAYPLPATSNGTPIPPLGSLPVNEEASVGGLYAGLLPPPNGAGSAVPVVGNSEAAGLPELSRDVFLSTSIDGQVMLWDRRVKNGAQGAVRRLPRSGKDGGWAASATWSTNGQQIYVGRRSAVVDIYDIRHSSPSAPTVQTLRLPSSSGAVSAISALPSGRHILVASNDNVRLWDLEKAKEAKGKVPPFVIVPGHHGGMVSQMIIDPRTQFMVTASGNRGYEGTSTENVVIHQVRTLA